MSAIYWHENPAFDAPELKSPQPCVHGAGCVFTVKDAEGKTIPGCCRYVHPGEEGTGRRLFAARKNQPACVRLINAGFYERRRLRLPWQAWCALKGIPFVRNEPGVRHEPVKRVSKPITMEELEASLTPINVVAMADSWPVLPSNGAVKVFKCEPAMRERVAADVMAYIAAHPEQGWDKTLALVKEAQAEYAAGVRHGAATLAEPEWGGEEREAPSRH
jgi:hypothetical protein